MKPPIWQPRDQIPHERRHYDPPTLWYYVILGSVAIHLSGLGILVLLLNVGLIGLQSGKKVVPIDVIAIAPQQPKKIIAPSPTSKQIAPKTVATPTKKPATTNSKPATRPVSPVKKKPAPAVKTNNSTTANSSPKPSGTPPAKPQPKVPTSQNTPFPVSPSPSKTPNNPPSGGSFIAIPGKIIPIAQIDRIKPEDPNSKDEPAKLLDTSKQLTTEELKQLGISLARDLELAVKIVVKTDGTAEVFAVQVVRGSINQNQAMTLASKIITQWRFEPTKMAGGKVYGNYSLPLTIRPKAP